MSEDTERRRKRDRRAAYINERTAAELLVTMQQELAWARVEMKRLVAEGKMSKARASARDADLLAVVRFFEDVVAARASDRASEAPTQVSPFDRDNPP
jgi:hypothetical protein